MSTLQIPQRNVEIKTLEIEKGELVLIRSKKQKEEGVSITLGVFKDGTNYEGNFYPGIFLSSSYYLRRCDKLGGQDVCLIEYGRNSYILNSDLEIIIGKENIVERLKENEKFAPHADWISKLNKPYLRY